MGSRIAGSSFLQDGISSSGCEGLQARILE